MYLTCPNCEAVFEISERHFVNGPRQVRCTACRQQWQAEADVSATINDLMGEEAEGAFEGLNNFLGSNEQNEAQATPPPPPQPMAPVAQPTANTEFRSDAISMALSRHEEKKGGGFFSFIFVFVLIPLGIFFGLKYGKEKIIELYPDAVHIYDFLETIWAVIVMAAEDLYEQALPFLQQLTEQVSQLLQQIL